MRILISKKPETIAGEIGELIYRRDCGLLQSAPDSYYLTEMPVIWGMDNGRYKCIDWDTGAWDISLWDKDAFLRFLERGQSLPGCKFVCVPDVLWNAQATTEEFWLWRDFIASMGYPVAYAVQDGVTLEMIPWGACDALFIGGTNALKFSELLRDHIMPLAKRLNLYVHWGRGSTAAFMHYAKNIGCDSVDSSAFAIFSKDRLPGGLAILQQTQPFLFPDWSYA